MPRIRAVILVVAIAFVACAQAALRDGDDSIDQPDASTVDGGCVASCDGRACGSDGCAGSCGECEAGELCDEGGRCVSSCTSDCSNRSCGDDGCGGSCGACAAGERCDDSGACVADCVPACAGASCGDDGCGGSCGSCGANESCVAGACVATCSPSCAGKACGLDGCGGSCGACGANQQCANGACVATCTASCAGRACGDDGCGGSCGACAANERCTNGGCVAVCSPSCAGKACGDDGCGGSCGACGGGETCEAGACIASCAPACTGRTCGDDTCGASCGACPSGQSCASGNCACATAEEVLVYAANGPWIIADALGADASGCAQHWIHVPAVADANGLKTMPRGGGALTEIRRQGPRFHSLAEFHWGSWSHVTGMTWKQKGVEFRRRMAAAGYDPRAGDSWAINELPSTTRTSATTRQNVIDVLAGLYTGPAGAPPMKGAVFVIGVGQNTVNLSTYKGQLEGWLSASSFWAGVAPYVRWWSQEVYPEPSLSCIPNTTVASRASTLNAFTEYLPELASAGPSSANTAQSFLGRAFVPLLGAVWDANGGYGHTTIPLSQMENFVSTEVYATRSWALSHNYPDGRIGFAWTHQTAASTADLTVLATRLAAAVHRGYDDGATAAHACSPSGAYTWCQCKLAGAHANSAWSTFTHW